MEARVLERDGLDALLRVLSSRGYEVIGPTLGDGVIVYDRIESVADLPAGWTADEDGGTYRLHRRDDEALFGYNTGATGWKRFLFPPESDLLSFRLRDGTMVVNRPDAAPKPKAFVGVRACELAAIGIQDVVFLGSGRSDRVYGRRRDNAFIVAVNCGVAGTTCFCDSMGTGPRCGPGADLVVTELAEEFVVEPESERGQEILGLLGGRAATAADVAEVTRVVEETAAAMGRVMPTAGLRELLVDNPEHPRWERVAARCLTCGNCTQACPTCFCSTMTDSVGLDGDAVRTRHWDSCFGLEFSGLHGRAVRDSVRARYRQWMTHKLATWHDQFGMSGCVGCGRCITWCPVGIDITEEVAAMRGSP